MKRFARALVVTLGLVVLSSFVFLVPQKNVTGAGGAPVFVQNTPLPISGNVDAAVTGTVNVGNFPATQNVSIANTPVPVSFSNTAAAPIFTRDADNTARNAWRRRATFSLSPTDTFSSDTFDLPVGKMLVIEAVQGSALYNNWLTLHPSKMAAPVFWPNTW